MTASELVEFLNAFTKKEMREWDRVAWQTAHLLNAWKDKKTKAVKVEDLLGRPMTDSKKKAVRRRTSEEAERERRFLKALDKSVSKRSE